NGIRDIQELLPALVDRVSNIEFTIGVPAAAFGGHQDHPVGSLHPIDGGGGILQYRYVVDFRRVHPGKIAAATGHPIDDDQGRRGISGGTAAEPANVELSI